MCDAADALALADSRLAEMEKMHVAACGNADDNYARLQAAEARVAEERDNYQCGQKRDGNRIAELRAALEPLIVISLQSRHATERDCAKRGLAALNNDNEQIPKKT